MAEAITLKKLSSFASGSIPGLIKLGNYLQRMLTFSPADESIFPQRGISVSIGKGNLCVAGGKRVLSRTVITGAKIYPLEDSSRYPLPEEAVSSLTLAINEFGGSKAGITLCIPKAWTIIRTVEFPSTVKENLASVVAYEMDRITPFASDEAFFDFKILKEENGKISLLVMAARTDAIMPFMTALTENGFTVKRVTVDLAGVGALCGQEGNDSDILFVSLDKEEFEGAQFAGGSLHEVFSGSFAASDDSSRADTLSAALSKLVEASRNRGRSSKIMVHVKGNNPSLIELLKVRMSVPLSILRPTGSRIRFAQAPQEIPYGAVGSLAESLRENRGMNLLKRGVYEKSKPPVVSTIALAAAIIAVWIIYMLAPLRIERDRLAEITHAAASKKAEVKKVEDLKKTANDLSAEIASINSFKEDKPMVLSIVRELTVVLPKTTWLTRVRVTETDVNIEGYAASASELVPKLEASKLFQKVEFASPTFRDVKMNSDRFVIKMEIEGLKKTAEPTQKTDNAIKKPAGEKPKHEKK